MVLAMEAEGWYRDPFKRHKDRWFSDGRPTALVRDDGTEGRDPPPDVPFASPLVEAASAEAENGSDLRRADDPPSGSDFDQDTPVVDRVIRWPNF